MLLALAFSLSVSVRGSGVCFLSFFSSFLFFFLLALGMIFRIVSRADWFERR